ncbi:hypothetical protein NJB1907f44_38900 [Mycobacterium marinum]|uniref:hypothetical protein n=1 Tax=Mycobacterium marinum TaxID=1781 RepID=UPI000EE67AC6|nr:hypothetical protein [Mycobacterium marinum]RFZ36156.1 hypothetical protein KST_03388 [Mycobacterium marinum]GJO14135.1 hypothetical protein NJB1907f34b_50370 [Mycobacterium marinum]GJO19844.1 hypothetical protein NJB1907E90_50120 [Mycobacterium marinum]GJO21183.1 hypothetical protein NJB1907E11_29640 [Mycobacterium marinum]GJO24974.1 hypothetical protein NJB1728e18_31190 [Mycobacterium marinum]
MSRPGGAQKGLLRLRPVLIAIGAGLTYGTWAALAHYDQDPGVALLAGLTQAALSFTTTLTMVVVLERLFHWPSDPHRGFLLAAFAVSTLSAAWLTTGHLLMGTPRVLAAIAPSVLIGTALYFLYARTLLVQAVRETARGLRGTRMPSTAGRSGRNTDAALGH